MSHDTKALSLPESADFETFVSDVCAIIDAGQTQVAAVVNQEVVKTYWEVGKRIVEEEQKGKTRAGYGERLLQQLGNRLLADYGRGFAEVSLRNMRQFYVTYPIRSALRSELTWTHYRTLMRIEDSTTRDFYTTLTVSNRWSSRELERQIRSVLHLRVAKAETVEQLHHVIGTIGKTPHELQTPAQVFKDPYILDFLGLEDTYSEKDLEAAVIRNIEKFLLELGQGFCFVARQERITIGDEDFYVDLVLYHRFLRSLVLIDLKIGRVTSADLGQMQLYLQWMKKYNKAPGENDPHGLILTGSQNEQVVQLMLESQNNQIRVAHYLPLKDVEALQQYLAKMQKALEQLEAGKKEDTK